jgi:uncharacterized repeat protein (TIGR01451 family)
MTTRRVHAGNRWLAGFTATLLLAVALVGLAPVGSVGAQAVPLLTVTKTADSATINAGDPIGFTITIASTGNGDVTLVHLTDQLFNVLPSAPDWTETTGNASCTIDGANLLSCSFASIASGTPAITLHVTAPTTQQDCGQTGNQALIDFEDFNGRFGTGSSNTASVDIICPTPAPTDTPTETATAVPPPPPLLTISKVADNATITAGDPIGFTITITNTGAGAATNVDLLDVLSQLNLPSAPAWTESPDNPFCLFDPSFDLHCDFGTIASGAPPITVHITAPTTDQDCGGVENTVRDSNETLQASASVTIVCPTATPPPTATETEIPATEVPTGTSAATETTVPATATSETTGGVTDLPNTGSSPGSGSGRTEVWLLLALLAVTAAGITGVRVKRSR